MVFNHTSRRQSERSGHSQAEASRPRLMEDLYSQVTARIVAELEEGGSLGCSLGIIHLCWRAFRGTQAAVGPTPGSTF
jgi:hypothetical protein